MLFKYFNCFKVAYNILSFVVNQAFTTVQHHRSETLRPACHRLKLPTVKSKIAFYLGKPVHLGLVTVVESWPDINIYTPHNTSCLPKRLKIFLHHHHCCPMEKTLSFSHTVYTLVIFSKLGVNWNVQ